MPGEYHTASPKAKMQNASQNTFLHGLIRSPYDQRVTARMYPAEGTVETSAPD